jgi:RNA polymerase-interacting CarD/CdnL/TRCF family regulator
VEAKSVTVRALTRSQKLANALRACNRKPKRQRAACKKRAHKQYGAVKKKKG